MLGGRSSYDALSRRTQMTRPNNVTTNYAYDNRSRLTSVLHQLAGSTIDGATYTLDNAGNRTARTDQRTAVATSYGYDNIYQLLSATQGATTTESYAYDPK
jgi:YD repeat-containing protein